jgi:membrane-associated protease RseP (regulator of RpoE activity)
MWKSLGGGLVGVAVLLGAARVVQAAQDHPAQAPRLSEYWIGVECYPMPEPLHAHLRLPEGQGLLVAHVMPESPAAKAGLREHDVLLKADGKPLGEVEDLVAAVEASKQGKLKLDVLRAGESKSVEVQPAKRPEAAQADEDMSTLRGWFDRVMPGENWPPRFYIFRPGTILPPGVSALPPLPNDTTVVITRHGSDPARILVEKGKQRWEVTEKELDKLPADLRPQVERMVHPYDLKPTTAGAGWPPAARGPTPAESRGRMDKQMQKHLEEMQRQIEELRRSMDDMRQKSKTPPATKGERL